MQGIYRPIYGKYPTPKIHLTSVCMHTMLWKLQLLVHNCVFPPPPRSASMLPHHTLERIPDLT